MKKILLSMLIILGLGFFNMANAQLVLKIVKTSEVEGVDVSFDDGEYENDAIDKLFDDDLDMGWEGEDGNIMTTFLRYRDVSIPQGTTIDSVFLYLYAHEDEPDPANINIYAEDVDNSAEFTEDETIDARTWTSAMIEWDITDPWTMWQKYKSPDLKTVVQEVINRSGWEAGNSLTLFFQGEDQGASLLDNARDFESFENIEDPADGGDGLNHPERAPQLYIYYTLPQVLDFKIVKSAEVEGVDVSFDDGEYENDAIDKLFDDDLDMGWEGEDGNIMTTFTRFQNVTIPQGQEIDSAFLYLYAHEDEPDPAFINIYAENISHSPRFTEDETIDGRTWTTTMIEWNITEPWTMWQPYRSPDLGSLVEEIVGREDWESGNALTLFFQGENQGASLLDNARDFESFENIEDPGDGGDGLHHPERVPYLKVYYKGAVGASKGFEPAYATGIRKFNAASAEILDVYPNPTNGNLNIRLNSSKAAVIEILDLTGKSVNKMNVHSMQISVDMSSLPKGIYILRAIQDNTVYVGKVSKN